MGQLRRFAGPSRPARALGRRAHRHAERRAHAAQARPWAASSAGRSGDRLDDSTRSRVLRAGRRPRPRRWPPTIRSFSARTAAPSATSGSMAAAVDAAVARLGLPARACSASSNAGRGHRAQRSFVAPAQQGNRLHRLVARRYLLFDAAAARPAPIPRLHEMGGLRPVFILPGARRSTRRFGATLADSATLGTGQFCTKPRPRSSPVDGSGFAEFAACALSCAAWAAEHRALHARELAARACTEAQQKVTARAQRQRLAEAGAARTARRRPVAAWQVSVDDWLGTPRCTTRSSGR